MTWSLWVPAWFISLVAGILSVYSPDYLILIVGIAFLFSLFLFFQYRSSLTIPLILMIFFVILLCFWIGRIRAQSGIQLSPASLPLEKMVVLKGTVADWPTYRTKSVEFLVHAQDLKFIAVLPIQDSKQNYDITKGDQFQASGILTLDKNPYTSPLTDGKKLEQTDTIAYFLIEDPATVKVGRGNLSSRFHRSVMAIREKAWAKLCGYSLRSDYTHFLGALWLGLEKENFPLQPLFQKIGLSHVLAISGSNFFWLAGLLLAILTWWGWHERKKTCFIIVVLFFYCALVGFQASTTRAFLMISMMLLARSKLEGYHSFYAMLYTAFLMLLWNPIWLKDLGFQLSFIGCAAFIFFPTPLLKGVGATFTTMPLTAFRFNLVSLSSILTNLLFLPALTIFYLLVGAFLLPGKIGYLPLKVGEMCWNILIFLMQLLSHLPYSYLNVRSYPIVLMIGYYGIFFGLLFWLKGFIPQKKAGKVVITLLFVLPIVFILFPGKSPYLSVTFLNVGQGDSALVQTRNGKTILIDTGLGKKENETFDNGERVLLPILRKSGVNQIDLLIISHYHDDHYGGMSAILEHIPSVKEIVLPRTMSEDASLFNQLFSTRLENTQIHYWCGHQQWRFDELEIELFSPPCDESAWSESENNRSLCFLMTYREATFLFTGDIEEETEKALLEQYGEKLQADILKVPHHGSQTSSTPSFIETVSPEYAVISCGSRAIFHHPAEKTLHTLESYDIPYHITFLQGSLRVITDGYHYEFTSESD